MRSFSKEPAVENRAYELHEAALRRLVSARAELALSLPKGGLCAFVAAISIARQPFLFGLLPGPLMELATRSLLSIAR